MAAGAVAGALGALLGIGGGVLLVPFLNVGVGLPMRMAGAVSLMTVIATASSPALAGCRPSGWLWCDSPLEGRGCSERGHPRLHGPAGAANLPCSARPRRGRPRPQAAVHRPATTRGRT